MSKRSSATMETSTSTSSSATSAAVPAGQPPQKKQKTHHPVLSFFITCNPNKKREAPAIKPPPYDDTDLFYIGYVQHQGGKKQKLHWHCIVQFRTKKTYEQVKAWYGCNWIKIQSLKDFGQAQKYLTDGHTVVVNFEDFGRYHTGTFRTDIEFAIHCAKRGKTQAYARRKRSTLYNMRQETIDRIWVDYAPKPDFQVRLQHDWQLELIQRIDAELSIPKENMDAMDWRFIHFVYNASGNSSKTAFMKYCLLHYDTFSPRPAKLADILHAYQGQRVVILDIPMSTDDIYVAWGTCEQIKDGVWFSPKYNSGVKYRTSSAVVIVFSNHPPPECKFSQDRIKLITI